MNKYDDIINLPHHVSKSRKRMSLEERSAQFAPFKALEGYSDSVEESERITSSKIILDEDSKEMINKKLEYIKNNLNIPVCITYFCKDRYKDGGKYTKVNSYIKEINQLYKQIILENKTKISMDDILDITLIKC